MTEPQVPASNSVDVVFPLIGRSLPRDHALDLQQALCAQTSWLATDALVGIHPIKLVPGTDSTALLSGRSCVVLRVKRQRAAELLELSGREISVAGHPLTLGAGHRREFTPHATLYAYKVAADSADEMDFMVNVSRALSELAIGAERVCGKRQQMAISGHELSTFSLMLHGLLPDQSMRLMECGIGPHRLLGCGIFIGHKSAAAV